MTSHKFKIVKSVHKQAPAQIYSVKCTCSVVVVQLRFDCYNQFTINLPSLRFERDCSMFSFLTLRAKVPVGKIVMGTANSADSTLQTLCSTRRELVQTHTASARSASKDVFVLVRARVDQVSD